MSESDIERAIEKQRWYFFANNDKIIFDRNIGLIWTNLNKFPYRKSTGFDYSSRNDYEEVRNLVADINRQNWGGYNNWKVPTQDELWIMIADKTFPFHKGYHWRINEEFSWCCKNYISSSVLCSRDLDDSGAASHTRRDRSAHVILCSDALRAKTFSPTAKEVLGIFKKNKLIPIFDSPEVTRLYKNLTEDKPKTPAKVKSPQIKFPAMINFSKYDAAAINKSPIKFYQSVSSAADEVLNYLQQYETAAAETISEASKILIKLNTKYIASPHLTAEENSLLEKRQQFLARRLELGTDDTKAQILSMKAQAEELAARIDEINHSKNSLFELAELEKLPRPSFEFLTENLTQIITFAQDKINFFVQNKNFVKAIVKTVEAWNDSYNSFKTNLKAQFENICSQNNIDAEIYNAWYEDWQKLRFEIEGRVLPLIEFALKENLGDTAIKSLGNFGEL